MTLLYKLIIIALFAAALLTGCRTLPPNTKPPLTVETLPQTELPPSAATTETAPPEMPSTSTVTTRQPPVAPLKEVNKLRLTYIVSAGDQLWSIAKRSDIYNDSLLWPLLYQANRDQIKDPRQIFAGQSLTIPRNISEEDREKARFFAKKSDVFSPE